MSLSPRRISHVIYPGLVTAGLLLSLAAFLASGWRAFRNPYQLNYGEGVVIWQTEHVTHLKQAYRDLSQYPHLVFHYPPLFHLTARLVGSRTGDALSGGRLLSLLATLGISLASGSLVWGALPRSYPFSVRGMGFLLGAFLCYSIRSLSWARYMRVDMLALFFEFVGILLYVRAIGRTAFSYLAFMCFFLALYTKQIAVAGPAACILTGLLAEPRKALKQTAFLAACGASAMAALIISTDGGFFQNLFVYNRNPGSISLLYFTLKPNIIEVSWLVPAAAALPGAFAVNLFSRDGRLRRFRAAVLRSPSHRLIVVGGIFLAVSFLTSFSAVKEGSDINYMLEWNLAACPLAALLITQAFYWWRRRQRLLPANAALLLTPLIGVAAGVHLSALAHEDELIAENNRNSASVVERIRQVKGSVYSEDMVVMYRAGKELAAEPNIITLLARTGEWDESTFVKRIDSGSFDLIVTRSPLTNRLMYSPRVRAAIERSYQSSEQFGEFRLYRPRAPVTASR